VLILLMVVAALLLLSVLTWGNLRFARENPGGNDFLVHWVGTRALITEGLNPYSDEVATRIQTIAYGRPARPGEHELRVAYPLYSIVVFAPFAFIGDFTLARAAWMTALEAGLILMTVLGLRLFRWRVGLIMIAILLLFAIFGYHGLRPLINGNVVILVSLWLVAGFLALRNGADELAGVLFAFSTIKPQVVVLALALVVFWAIVNRRWRVITWMFATVFLLSASSALLIPDWILHNLREVIRYPAYNPPGTPQAAFQVWWPAWGERVGWALTATAALILMVEWWSNRHTDSRGLLWTASLTLVLGQWIGIQTDPGNFVALFPAILLVFSLLDERWRPGGRIFVIVALLVLFVGLWAIFLNTLEAGSQPIQSPIMFFPLPAFLLITLYWVRWWALQPPALWIDMVSQ